MDNIQIICVVICTVFAVSGLILLVLQEKGIIKSFLTQETKGFDFVGAEKVIILAVGIGTLMMYQIGTLHAIIYVALFIMAFLLIKFFVK